MIVLLLVSIGLNASKVTFEMSKENEAWVDGLRQDNYQESLFLSVVDSENMDDMITVVGKFLWHPEDPEINEQSHGGLSALILAVLNNDLEGAKFLCDSGIRLDLQLSRVNGGLTAFEVARKLKLTKMQRVIAKEVKKRALRNSQKDQ